MLGLDINQIKMYHEQNVLVPITFGEKNCGQNTKFKGTKYLLG